MNNKELVNRNSYFEPERSALPDYVIGRPEERYDRIMNFGKIEIGIKAEIGD